MDAVGLLWFASFHAESTIDTIGMVAGMVAGAVVGTVVAMVETGIMAV